MACVLPSRQPPPSLSPPVRLVRVPNLFNMTNESIMTTSYARFYFVIVPVLRRLFFGCAGVHFLVVFRLVLSEQGVKPRLYLEALYYVLYTLTGVGYGLTDVVIDNVAQKLFACFLFIIGLHSHAPPLPVPKGPPEAEG